MPNLNVPPLDPARRQADLQPKTVAAWLARLPYASPTDAAQQLMSALYVSNRQAIGADTRLALLALYRPAVLRVAASLEAQLADAGVPPHALQRQTGTLLRELRTELAIGYKQALLALNNGEARHSGKRLGETAARALDALYEVQLACHLTYSPLPASLWSEIRGLMRVARAAGVADKAVDDAPSASLAYRRALLTALADPPHLSPAELSHTRLYLDRFAALATLAAAPVEGRRGFAATTTGADAPTPRASVASDDGLWLDTDDLCRHLHGAALRLRTGDTPRRIGLPAEMDSEISLKLCKRLFKLWSGGVQRGFKRYADAGSTVEAVAGVSAIHHLLAGPAADADAESWHVSICDTGLRCSTAAPVSRWRVDNDSAAGLAVCGTPETPLNLKVGEPLAIRGTPAACWSLAVIRWIRMRDARQVQLGLQRLSPNAEAVWVRPLRGHRKASLEPALFIPGLAPMKQADRLLLPRHLYQIGMDAELWQAQQQTLLTFGQRLEHTPSYDLIDFTPFTDPVNP